MANAWTTEDRTIFKNVITSFEANLNTSLNVAKYGTDGELMERANDVIHRPVPMIVTSEDRVVGTDTVARDATELKVPSALDQAKTVPLKLNALELRDPRRVTELTKASGKRLASNIENSVQSEIADLGSLTVDVTGASGSYDDIALAESLMLEQGMDMDDRCLGLNARDYAGIAGNLQQASRSFGNEKSDTAFERSYIGMVAGFDTFKLDAGKRIAAAAGTCTLDTTGANVQYAPTANTDNRTQTITFNAVSGVAVGDRFTVAGLEAVHHISKESTGQLKTFVVTAVNGNDLTISPPIIGANSTPTDAEEDYKNVEVVSTSATAAVVFLNQNASNANYFWTKDSIELLAGRYAVPADQGPQVMRGTTDQGIELCMTKEFSGKNYVSLYHFDILYGVTNLATEKNGLILFNQ